MTSRSIRSCAAHPAPRFEPHLDLPQTCADSPNTDVGGSRCHSRSRAPRVAGHAAEAAPRHCLRTTGRARRRSAPPIQPPLEFAQHSMRTALEVVDGRRPATALRRLATPSVVAAVTTLARTSDAERRLGPAVLVRLNIAVVAPGAVEVFGGYERGPRRFALAGRLGCVRGRWRVAALRLR